MLILGDKEVEENQIAVRHRQRADLGATTLQAFHEGVAKEIKTHGHELFAI
jgi:threonyl-tRNA synthetase